jgi:hypothetical protein
LIITLIALPGCQHLGNNKTDIRQTSEQKLIETDTNFNTRTVSSGNQNKSNNNGGNATNLNTSTYSTIFKNKLLDSDVDLLSYEARGEIGYVNYTTKAENVSEYANEIKPIITTYALTVNRSYHSKDDWPTSRIHVVGFNDRGIAKRSIRVDDWRAADYIVDNQTLDNYLNGSLATNEYWPSEPNIPPTYDGEHRYMEQLRTDLIEDTNIDIQKFSQHGAELFLTYDTNREPGTDRYLNQVVNVSNVFRKHTVGPALKNRTGGWWAGVLNIEVRNGGDTIEWYSYQHRWGIAVERGEMSRENELKLLLSISNFKERDKLRD